jgi:glycolate oxidase
MANVPKLYRPLASRLPDGVVTGDPAIREAHAGDKWFARAVPDVVALPTSAAEVAAILRFATALRIPVTPRGAGHGYVGGCVPSAGGIALSLERLNKIIEINARDFAAVVQPAVRTAHLQRAAARKGLFYPPDPASREDCSLGGNIATNAGGPRCLKYGVTRDYVLGLEVALPTGELVRLGGRCHKNKTGFDLHRLFVGSEGMLGVVTEATLKLLPHPAARAALGAGFKSMAAAARAIRRVFAEGYLPSAVEVADAFTLNAARRSAGRNLWPGCEAHLIIEVDGSAAAVKADIAALAAVVQSCKAVFCDTAADENAVEAFWKVRRGFSYALRDTGLTKLNEDVVVPRGRLEALFHLAEDIQKRHSVAVACFGHAGDGNIHVNVMIDREDPGARHRGDEALDDLFKGVIALGGAITGEHGVGLAKMPWWPLAADAAVQSLHRTIKAALDPAWILNPGKFIDQAPPKPRQKRGR